MIQKLPTHFFVALLLLLLSSHYSHAIVAVPFTGWTSIGGDATLKCLTTTKRTVEFAYDYLIQGPEIFGATLDTIFSVSTQHYGHDYVYFIDDNSTNAGNYTSIVGSQRRVVQKIRHTFEKDGIYNASYKMNTGAFFVSDGRDREPFINGTTGQIDYYFNFNIGTDDGMFDPVNITGDSCYIGPIDTDDGDGDGDGNETDDDSGASSIKKITTNTIWLFAMAGLHFFWS